MELVSPKPLNVLFMKLSLGIDRARGLTTQFLSGFGKAKNLRIKCAYNVCIANSRGRGRTAHYYVFGIRIPAGWGGWWCSLAFRYFRFHSVHFRRLLHAIARVYFVVKT